MQLPKVKKGEDKIPARKQKICAAVDKGTMQPCGKEFKGRPMQKYCEFHMSAATRFRPRQQLNKFQKDADEANIRIEYMGETGTVVEMECRTCGAPYRIELSHRQFWYPANCPKHRNAYKRELHRREIRKRVEVAV